MPTTTRPSTKRPPAETQRLVLDALRVRSAWSTVEDVRLTLGLVDLKYDTIRKTLVALAQEDLVERKTEPIEHGIGPRHLWRAKA